VAYMSLRHTCAPERNWDGHNLAGIKGPEAPQQSQLHHMLCACATIAPQLVDCGVGQSCIVPSFCLDFNETSRLARVRALLSTRRLILDLPRKIHRLTTTTNEKVHTHTQIPSPTFLQLRRHRPYYLRAILYICISSQWRRQGENGAKPPDVA
jgi:hypothetical protein